MVYEVMVNLSIPPRAAARLFDFSRLYAGSRREDLVTERILCAKIVSRQRLAVDSHGLPVRMALTAGTPAYCTQAPFLTADVVAKYKLADRGYDRDAIVAQAEEQGMEADIPPRRNRQEPLDCDRGLYNLRHLLENALRTFRQWRGVATRYAKTEASFSAICKKRAIVMGTKSS